MNKKIAFLLGVLAVAGMIWVPWGQVMAARGTPGSSEFGFGAHIRLDGDYTNESIRLAADLQIDWLAIDIQWQNIQPARDSAINWTSLESVIAEANRRQVALLVSLTGAPDWALTQNGPDSGRVIQLVQQITARFGKTLKAIELFPGANTRSGWGAAPSPKAYLALYQNVQKSLQAGNSAIILVAGGLVPAGIQPDPASMDDLAFLDSLYKAGPKTNLAVISIQLGTISGTPMTSTSKNQHNVLRYYEEVREVMLRNNQENGLIWVTRLHPVLASTAPAASQQAAAEQESAWLVQAFQQMRAQLYLGVAFLDAINPGNPANDAFSLISPSGDYHPAYRFLREQIALNNAGSLGARPGQAKAAPLPRNP